MFEQANINIVASQGGGRLAAPIHVKFGTTKGHMGLLRHTKFHANRFTWLGTWPQNIKNFHFWQRVASQGRTSSSISKIFMGLYTPDYLALVFQI